MTTDESPDRRIEMLKLAIDNAAQSVRGEDAAETDEGRLALLEQVVVILAQELGSVAAVLEEVVTRLVQLEKE